MFHGLTTSLTARLALRRLLDDDGIYDARRNAKHTGHSYNAERPRLHVATILHCTRLEKTNPDQH